MSVECYQLKLMTKKMLSAKANDEKIQLLICITNISDK